MGLTFYICLTASGLIQLCCCLDIEVTLLIISSLCYTAFHSSLSCLIFHPQCCFCRSLQSMIDNIATVYSEVSITLAVIIFNPALIAAPDLYAASSWSLVFVPRRHCRVPLGSALLLSGVHTHGA